MSCGTEDNPSLVVTSSLGTSGAGMLDPGTDIGGPTALPLPFSVFRILFFFFGNRRKVQFYKLTCDVM